MTLVEKQFLFIVQAIALAITLTILVEAYS